MGSSAVQRTALECARRVMGGAAKEDGSPQAIRVGSGFDNPQNEAMYEIDDDCAGGRHGATGAGWDGTRSHHTSSHISHMLRVSLTWG